MTIISTDSVKAVGTRIMKRLRPFGDVGFWILTLLSLVPLMLLSPAMTKTMLQWSAFFVALAGASLLICRVFLPQVDLTEYLKMVKADPKNTAAALVVLSVCILLGTILLGMVLWARS